MARSTGSPGTTSPTPPGTRPPPAAPRSRRRITPRPRERLAHALSDAAGGSGWRRAALLRRTAAGLLAGVALVLALIPRERGSPVVVAARDLASGTALATADLAVAAFPAALVPVGALRARSDADGRVLVGAARAGEPLTDLRLAGPDAAARMTGRPGDAAVPVRLPDPDVARLLRPGSRVDVVTPGRDDDRPVVLASDAAVLTVLAAESDGPGAPRGRLVLVALPRPDAARVAAAAVSEQVAVTLR